MICDSGNKGAFEPMLESMQNLAQNSADPSSQRAAFSFLSRCVSVWGTSGTPPVAPNGNGGVHESQGLPGFERFIYERLVPSAFNVLSSPEFNIKDGQALGVSLYRLLISNLLTYDLHR